VPKTLIYRLIRKGEVRVNMRRAKPSDKLCYNDSIRTPPIRTSQIPLKQQFSTKISALLDKAIIYEDKDFMVINKPIGMAVHGGSGVSFGVIEALREVRSDLSYIELIHRLDKDTSGCLLLAKKRSVLKAIQALFGENKIHKTYLALLIGKWEGKKTTKVSLALKKEIKASGERHMRIDKSGKESTTTFTLLKNSAECCLVEAKPQTGRMHQIRVHSASLGHPILGDAKYSKGESVSFLTSKRLYLHAAEIKFIFAEKKFHFKAPLDKEFQLAFNILTTEGKL